MHRSDEVLPAMAGTSRAQQPREHKPPPIYVYGVTNYQDMVSYLTATQKTNWTDCVRNEQVLHTVEEDRNIPHKVNRRKANGIGYIA
jgi:aminopeptidase-like protein